MTNTSFLYAPPHRGRKKPSEEHAARYAHYALVFIWKKPPPRLRSRKRSIARGPSHRARRSPAVRHCTASPVRRKETRAASRKSPAVQSLYPFPPHAARSRPPPMPPYGGIGGGRSCSAARRVLHTSPSGHGFQKPRAPAGNRQAARVSGKKAQMAICRPMLRQYETAARQTAEETPFRKGRPYGQPKRFACQGLAQPLANRDSIAPKGEESSAARAQRREKLASRRQEELPARQ